MRRADIISGFVLIVFGLFMIFIVIPLQIEPGPSGMMSPSLVPTMMMGLIVALSLLLVTINIRKKAKVVEATSPPPITARDMLALLKIGGIFAVAIGSYLWLSPLAAGASLVIGALLALGERRPVVLVLMPVALLFAIWYLFYQVLGTAII